MENTIKLLGMFMLNIIVISALSLISGAITMVLWNWLMPIIFGLVKISYWQGWGIMFLSGLMFKSSPYTTSRRRNNV